jgi:formylglycine-generating enzyme required for sulfatase activity
VRLVSHAWILLTLAASLASCGGGVADARSQWVVDIYTDAPVPQLGDRLLVELLAPDASSACSGCRRLFGMNGPSAWPLSFGIPDDAGGTGLRLRARLFRSDHSDAGGGPAGGVPIDVLARLPPTGGGVRRVALTLSAACAGVAADLASSLTCDPTTGALVARTLGDDSREDEPRPGSFAAAQPVPCSRAPREGMVCVPGGLLVRGSDNLVLGEYVGLASAPERLVHLSPFALDREEMTVRTLRALVTARLTLQPVLRSADAPACTYTEAPGAFDGHPVNCISRDRAASACAAQGKRLPTEAEWEFAAGGRDEERRYPWGADPDACHYAIVGRGRESGEGAVDSSSICRRVLGAAPLPWGPRPESESDDVTLLGIRHLGGNVSEWVADSAGSYDGPCSAGPPVLVDPRCDTARTGLFVARGGTWALQPFVAQVGFRSTYADDRGHLEVGFRCAESL